MAYMGKDSDFKSLIIRGASLSLIWRGIGFVSGYILAIFISNWLGAGAYGRFSIFLSLISLIVIPAKFGIDRAVIKLLALRDESGNGYDPAQLLLVAGGIVLCSSLMCSILFYLIAPDLVISIYGDSALVPKMQFVALSIAPLSLLILFSESFRGLNRAGAYAFCQHALRNGLPLAIISFFFIVSEGTEGENIPELSYLIGISAAVLISIYLLYVEIKGIMREDLQMKIGPGGLIKLSFPMLIASSAIAISTNLDTLMLRYFESDAIVGNYNAALKLAMLLSFAITSINALSAPQFSKLFHSGKIQEFRSSVQFTSKLITIAALPILFAVGFFPGLFLSLFGDGFENARLALQILCIGYFINAFCGPVDLLLQMVGKEKAFQWIIILSTVLNIVLNLILIPVYGLNGAAIATTISISVWNLSSLIYVRRKFGFWTNSLLGRSKPPKN